MKNESAYHNSFLYWPWVFRIGIIEKTEVIGKLAKDIKKEPVMCQRSSFYFLKRICELSDDNYVVSKTLKEYKDCKKKWEEYVSSLEYIFVGDNPGLIEKSQEEYFCYDTNTNEKSKTGENTHKFIRDFLELSADKILFLNKSLKWSKETTDLYNGDCEEDKSISLIVEFILSIVNENKNVFVCIFGIDSFHADYFSDFVRKIRKLKKIGLYPHPSRRQPISIKEQLKIGKIKDRNEFFKIYGQIRLNDENNNKSDLIRRCIEELGKK